VAGLSDPNVSPLIDSIRNTRIAVQRVCFPAEVRALVASISTLSVGPHRRRRLQEGSSVCVGISDLARNPSRAFFGSIGRHASPGTSISYIKRLIGRTKRSNGRDRDRNRIRHQKIGRRTWGSKFDGCWAVPEVIVTCTEYPVSTRRANEHRHKSAQWIIVYSNFRSGYLPDGNRGLGATLFPTINGYFSTCRG
jgi:hypothetical protein